MKNKKIIPIKRAAQVAKRLKKAGKKIVFTNGCFDLLHAGHLKVFSQCKKMGDVLMVGLNSDASVKRLKGPQRPILGSKDRADIIAGLEPVDYVVIFPQDTPKKLIQSIQPAVLAKGGDWNKKDIVGAEFAKTVRRIPLVRGRSTTGIIKKILKAYG